MRESLIALAFTTSLLGCSVEIPTLISQTFSSVQDYKITCFDYSTSGKELKEGDLADTRICTLWQRNKDGGVSFWKPFVKYVDKNRNGIYEDSERIILDGEIWDELHKSQLKKLPELESYKLDKKV